MDCKHADRLIMQYAEKAIQPNDAKNLAKHLLECKDCREGFVAFDICLDETQVQEAPEGFTGNVMSGVMELKTSCFLPVPELLPRAPSRFMQVLVGFGAILAGVMLFFALNFGYAGDVFYSVPELALGFSDALVPFFESISLSLSASGYFSRITFVFVPVLSVLLFVLHNSEATPGDTLEA